MTPPAPERPSTQDDLRNALRAKASFGVKLFEINVLQAIFAACPNVQVAGDLLILRETLLEELGPAYMWLINLSLIDWQSLSEKNKELNTQMRLDWLASYSKASEVVLQNWFWKLLKSKTQNFAPLHHVFVRVLPGSLKYDSDAWTEIFLLYPLTGASIAHKLLAHGLQKCLAFKDDSPAACTEYIALINTSVSQLGHMKDMSVCDVFALVTLIGLYISTASGHQKAYKELLAYVDADNALTLDDVQHAMIRYSRSKPNRVFSVRRNDARCSNSCPRCCSSVRSDAACNHRWPRCCDTRDRMPDPSSIAPAVALVAPRAVPIPIGLTRIRRSLPNASSFGDIVACRRKSVSMPLCLSETTWSPIRFSLRLAAQIIKTNTHTPLSLKLQRTSCVWAVNLPTTKML
jgi:hypothetical protein